MNRTKTLALLGALTLMGLPSITVAAETVIVNLNSEKQTIRGFGGMNHRVWTGYDLNASDRNLAFGNGAGQIGLTVLRIWVSDKESDWALELPTAKDVVARGGIVYASPWNPPAAIQTPYTLVRWGTSYQTHMISPSNYTAYVTHLNKFVKYMKDNGVPLYAISIQNEPDWCDAWTCWTADEVYNFTKSHAANLRLHGTKVISAESFAYSKGYYDKIINDAAALSNIDIIGAHFYGSTAASPNSFFQYPLADQKATTKERWMTEHYTDSKGDANLWRGYIITGDQDQTPTYDTVRALDVAYEMHRGLVEGNFNQYTWWYTRRDYGPIKNSGTGAGQVSKRGYCMAQYAKFVRPGFVRVDATKNPDTQVFVSAYKKADSVVIVVVNRSGQKTVSFSVPNATGIQSWKKYTTSETKSLKDDGAITATNGAFSASFDQESITTLVGIGSVASSSSSSVLSSSSVPSSSSSAETRAPYSSTIQIPGRIEAENYDRGGQGIAYNDSDPENKGNVLRTDGVDITGDAATGYKVGWTTAGEWMEYSVNVKTAGNYQWSARVASGGDGSSFTLQIGTQTITETVPVPNGGTWDTYTTITGQTRIPLAVGPQIIRLNVVGAYFNIDWFELAETTVKLNTLPVTANRFGKSNHQVFNLQGVRQDPQESGIYIVKTPGTSNASLKINLK